MTIWLTGLSSSGKSTIAAALQRALSEQGRAVEWLDGDCVRQTVSRGLGFTREDRNENVARIAWVAQLLARHGVVVVVSATSPFRDGREQARRLIGEFIEVFVDAPLDVCEARDSRAVYARARRGEIAMVPGIDMPYEPPVRPEIHCRTAEESVPECVERILRLVG